MPTTGPQAANGTAVLARRTFHFSCFFSFLSIAGLFGQSRGSISFMATTHKHAYPTNSASTLFRLGFNLQSPPTRPVNDYHTFTFTGWLFLPSRRSVGTPRQGPTSTRGSNNKTRIEQRQTPRFSASLNLDVLQETQQTPRPTFYRPPNRSLGGREAGAGLRAAYQPGRGVRRNDPFLLLSHREQSANPQPPLLAT